MFFKRNNQFCVMQVSSLLFVQKNSKKFKKPWNFFTLFSHFCPLCLEKKVKKERGKWKNIKTWYVGREKFDKAQKNWSQKNWFFRDHHDVLSHPLSWIFLQLQISTIQYLKHIWFWVIICYWEILCRYHILYITTYFD